MNEKKQLEERNKELNCLYKTDNLLSDEDDLFKVFNSLCQIIADAFLFPSLARVKIRYHDLVVCSPYFITEKEFIKTNISESGKTVGEINVFYSTNPEPGIFPFLPEEQQLLDSLGKRLSDYFNIRKSSCFLAKDRKNIYSTLRNDICTKAVDALDFTSFGISAIYLIGSVKSFTSGIGSDIDLIINYNGSTENFEKITIWFQAWSASVATNSDYEKSIQIDGSLFDLHFITKKDIIEKNSYAIMIDSMYNNAKLIKSV